MRVLKGSIIKLTSYKELLSGEILSTSNSKYSNGAVASNCTCVLYIVYSGYLWIIALGGTSFPPLGHPLSR